MSQPITIRRRTFRCERIHLSGGLVHIISKLVLLSQPLARSSYPDDGDRKESGRLLIRDRNINIFQRQSILIRHRMIQQVIKIANIANLRRT